MIMNARKRCKDIPGLEDLLLNLVQFDGNARMSYEVEFVYYCECIGVTTASCFSMPCFDQPT